MIFSNKNNAKIHCTALIVKCNILIFISRILGIRTFGWLQILNNLFIGISTSVNNFYPGFEEGFSNLDTDFFITSYYHLKLCNLLRSRVANETLEYEIHVMLTNLNNKPVVYLLGFFQSFRW